MTDKPRARLRLWDSNMNCIYDSATDPRTVEQFMADRYEANYTIDQGRTRREGRIIKTQDGVIRGFDRRGYLAALMALPEPDFGE